MRIVLGLAPLWIVMLSYLAGLTVVDVEIGFIKAQHPNSDDVSAHFIRAQRRQHNFGQPGLACADYDAVLQFNPTHWEARVARAECRLELRDFEGAFSDLQEVAALGFVDPWAHKVLGDTYVALGNSKQALKNYDTAIQISPKYEAAYMYRAILYRKLGLIDEAANDFLDAGNIQYDMQEFVPALASFDELINLLPECSIGYYNRGNAFYQLGWKDKAIRDFSRAIELDNHRTQDAYYNRAQCYMGLRQHEKAIADYSTSIVLGHIDDKTYYNRGCAHLSLGKYKQAIADFSTCIELNATHADALYCRGIAVLESGGPKESVVADLRNAVRVNQHHTYALNELKVLGL